MCYVWGRVDNALKNVSSYRFVFVYKHCFAFLFGSINRFLKQNVSPNQQSFEVTFVAAVSLFWTAVQNLTSPNFEDVKIVGDF